MLTDKSILTGKPETRLRPGGGDDTGGGVIHKALTKELQATQAELERVRGNLADRQAELAEANGRAEAAMREAAAHREARDLAEGARKSAVDAHASLQEELSSAHAQLLEQTQGRAAAEGEARALRAHRDNLTTLLAQERQARKETEQRAAAVVAPKPTAPVAPPSYEMNIARDGAGEIRSVTLVPRKGD